MRATQWGQSTKREKTEWFWLWIFLGGRWTSSGAAEEPRRIEKGSKWKGRQRSSCHNAGQWTLACRCPRRFCLSWSRSKSLRQSRRDSQWNTAKSSTWPSCKMPSPWPFCFFQRVPQTKTTNESLKLKQTIKTPYWETRSQSPTSPEINKKLAKEAPSSIWIRLSWSFTFCNFVSADRSWKEKDEKRIFWPWESYKQSQCRFSLSVPSSRWWVARNGGYFKVVSDIIHEQIEELVD